MMSAVAQARDSYLEAFARFEGDAAGSNLAWLRSIRGSAMARFSELGFPTTHDEDWRFTNVSSIGESPFSLVRDGAPELSVGTLAQFGLPDFASTRLVFVNGRYSPGLSRLGLLPRDVRIGSLAEAFSTDPDWLQEHLGRYADYQHDAFSALNTAFMQDGALVRIPPRTVIEEPIYLLHISAPGDVPVVAHPRNLIVAGDETQATIVEDYVSLDGDVHFSNVVTEVVVGENSLLGHYRIERESEQTFHISTLRIEQGRASTVASHSLLLGGALVRNNVHPVLSGEGGDCLINGLFMGAGRQHLDNYMLVEHTAPHCTSRQFYNGILDDRSRGVFHGRIIVRKDAQKTNAKQTNRNLLLSEEAQIDTKPQLEIHADDVRCTHGATIGQLDEDAVFYLRSRGIPEASARDVLLVAFAGESLERMKEEPVRRHLEGLVRRSLPRERVLEVAR